jgi:hypothetical protein
MLLAIGGVTATVEGDEPASTAAVTAPTASGAGAAPAASAAAKSASLPASGPASSALPKSANHNAEGWHVEVVGGLAVPFFVLVMSFIGGAVSLSRRIPEYQRRLNPAYTGTPEQCKMREFEAREAVVFQIMQLISAPFLAIATWYIISPSSLAAASTLAFGTGFASETLLLMIRGLVSGIRPENSRFPPADASQAPGAAAPDPSPSGVALVGTVLPVPEMPLPSPLTLEVRADGAAALVASIAVAADGSFSAAQPLAPARYTLTPTAGTLTFKPVQVDLPAQGLTTLTVQLET